MNKVDELIDQIEEQEAICRRNPDNALYRLVLDALRGELRLLLEAITKTAIEIDKE